MRTLYAERQAVLLKAAGRELSGYLELSPSSAGTHLVGWLREGIDDQLASQTAARLDVVTQPLSYFHLEQAPRGGLLLGYGAFQPKEIRDGVRRLAAALRDLGRSK